jgi:hypothetical protein
MNQRLLTTVSALLAAALLAACGGGGGGGGGTTTPPVISGSTKSVAVNGSGPVTASFDTLASGITASVTLPATTGGSATLTATLTATPPSGLPAVSDALRRPKNVGGTLTPLAYISVSSNATVGFTESPGVVFTPSGSVPAYAYLAGYDSTTGWVAVAGATTLVNGTFTFSPIGSVYNVTSAPSYLAVFATASLESVIPPGNTDPLTCSAYAVSAQGQRRAPRANAQLAAVSPNRLCVTRQDDSRTTAAVRSAVNTERILALGGEHGLVHEGITLAPGTDIAKAAAQLRATSGVVSVDAVHRRYLAADSAANDPLLDTTDQWYLYTTNVESAWTLTHGTGIRVAVIDTGVDETNADLLPKLDKTEAIVGGVITTSAQDTNGHGTNVAGLVAASTNNGYGFASTGWDVHLLAYKIFADATSTSDCQGADTLDEAAAIGDAVANGASVISLSLGSPQSGGADAAEQAAVTSALANNVTVVAAAGNEGPGSPPDYPAAYPGVIAVGASAVDDTVANVYASITDEKVASYSNDSPALVAPGGDALADDPNGTPDQLHWITGYSTTTAGKIDDRCTGNQGVCEVLFNGTSQATPQVSAAVALMMAKHGGTRSLTPAQASAILTATANPIPGTSATRQGAGRLNVGAAVAGS